MSLPFSPACERNRSPIATVIDPLLPPRACVLEIGAGTGQHAEYFLSARPDLRWLATDVPERLDGLRRRLETVPGVEVQALAVGRDRWPSGPFDAVFSANTLHILPAALTGVVLSGASRSLKTGGCFLVYGPFRDGDRHTSDSNLAFDRSPPSARPGHGDSRPARDPDARGRCGSCPEGGLQHAGEQSSACFPQAMTAASPIVPA
jgi:SAM-dependent methyltransferase